MLLYEQRLHELMIQIIPDNFATQDQPSAKAAADTWRLPFWDWAMKKPDWPNGKVPVGPNVPEAITRASVDVITKTGTATVANPMWKFYLPKANTTFGDVGITEIGPYPVSPFPPSIFLSNTASSNSLKLHPATPKPTTRQTRASTRHGSMVMPRIGSPSPANFAAPK
jgi:hypothetical protein